MLCKWHGFNLFKQEERIGMRRKGDGKSGDVMQWKGLEWNGVRDCGMKVSSCVVDCDWEWSLVVILRLRGIIIHCCDGVCLYV